MAGGVFITRYLIATEDGSLYWNGGEFTPDFTYWDATEVNGVYEGIIATEGAMVCRIIAVFFPTG